MLSTSVCEQILEARIIDEVQSIASSTLQQEYQSECHRQANQISLQLINELLMPNIYHEIDSNLERQELEA